jgi:NAD(P)-dependent dehydrogenase (short-subunit alcohol dehydrogenase family)
MSVWFITGASRGFGAEITRSALAAGHQVAAAAREPQTVARLFPEGGGRLLPVPLDVTSQAQAVAAVEEASDTAVRAVYETNVFGTLNVLRAVRRSCAPSGPGGS